MRGDNEGLVTCRDDHRQAHQMVVASRHMADQRQHAHTVGVGPGVTVLLHTHPGAVRQSSLGWEDSVPCRELEADQIIKSVSITWL